MLGMVWPLWVCGPMRQWRPTVQLFRDLGDFWSQTHPEVMVPDVGGAVAVGLTLAAQNETG